MFEPANIVYLEVEVGRADVTMIGSPGGNAAHGTVASACSHCAAAGSRTTWSTGSPTPPGPGTTRVHRWPTVWAMVGMPLKTGLSINLPSTLSAILLAKVMTIAPGFR